jgi:hypothetical protein
LGKAKGIGLYGVEDTKFDLIQKLLSLDNNKTHFGFSVKACAGQLNLLP